MLLREKKGEWFRVGSQQHDKALSLKLSASACPFLMAPSLRYGRIRAGTQLEVGRQPVVEKRGALEHRKEAGGSVCPTLSWEDVLLHLHPGGTGGGKGS